MPEYFLHSFKGGLNIVQIMTLDTHY